ncbi:ArsR family transcriptional regulator [Thermococcus eurythermalis]|uniref:ArsR family transcriptional regulator n=1 Tax=Thermococcus eurythermalis TaxID=1505907 RepID=A0A097QS77_9EURY|nr:transcriptional regulator [Thermococcus eurythermalis]AIU69340.1 ArsR family transcriptional regulator [Thermococcus eurythermalis]
MEPLRELTKNHVLGNPIRLGIVLYLLPRRKALFKELLEVLEVTPGNLDSHLKALEREGYVELYKVFADRPRTAVRITEKGVEETARYLKALKSVLEGIE